MEFVNFPEAIELQIESDLDFVFGMKGAHVSPLFKRFYGSMGEDSFRRYLAPVKYFIYATCSSEVVVACADPQDNSNRIHINPSFDLLKLPQLVRISFWFHEIRHLNSRNDYWLETACPKPFRDKDGDDVMSIFSGNRLEGLGACSDSWEGAYAYQEVLLRNIAEHCDNCDAKLKIDAEFYADYFLQRITNPAAAKILRDDAAQSDEICQERMLTRSRVLGQCNYADPSCQAKAEQAAAASPCN